MRIISMVLLLSIISFPSFSQIKTKVILQNGSKLKGRLLESSDTQSILIDLGFTEPSIIPYDSIYYLKGKGIRYFNPPNPQRQGWYGQVESGLIFARENDLDGVTPQPFLHLLGGYAINTVYRPGVGVGFDRFSGITFMPFYGSFDYDFGINRKTIYLNARIGYSAVWRNGGGYYDNYDDTKAGLYWSIGGGYRVQYFRSRVYISVRYINQSATLKVEDFGFTATEKRKFRNIAFGLAYLFGQ